MDAERVSLESVKYLANNIKSKLFSKNKYKLIATCFKIIVDKVTAERS